MINKEQLKKELPQFRQTAQDFLDKKLSVVGGLCWKRRTIIYDSS